MMLSRTGWDETLLPVAHQTAEGRRAPWGCAAGAPYRGTASPPPPPPIVHAATHQGNPTGSIAPKRHLRILEDCPHHALR